MNRHKTAFGLGLILAGLAAQPARACELKIVWKADLSGDKIAPAVATSATGTATVAFDFTRPTGAVEVDTKGLQDVRSIELHVARSYTDHTGPAVFTLYTPADGLLPAALIRHIAAADLHPQADPKIQSFADVVQAVLGGRAYVTVSTRAHPQGELSGFISMRKEAVYSDDPHDPAHDPALHHAARLRPSSSP